MMRCGTVRRLLWMERGPHGLSDELRAAESHAAACEPCRRFGEEMRALAGNLQDAVPEVRAPAAVREACFAAIARERASGGPLPKAQRGFRRAASVAALVAAVGGGLWALWRLPRGSGDLPIAAVAEDHLRTLHEGRIETSDPAVIERWLRQRVAFAVHIPALSGAALEGAHVCFVSDRRGAVLQYRVDGHLLSYYVMPGEEQDDARPAATAFLEKEKAGYRVVAWRHAGLVHALVGDLPRGRLVALADTCRQQLAVTAPGPDGPAGSSASSGSRSRWW